MISHQVAVCWDIDGTLLQGGRVGGQVLRRAFHAIAGLEAPDGVIMGGLTDWLVAGSFLDQLPAETAAPLRARGDAFGDELVAEVAREWAGREDELRAVARTLPGVPETVAALAAERGVTQVVVTGNVRAGAERKLAAVGLHPSALDLDLGAYGDHPGPRVELVRAARTGLEAQHSGPVTLVVVGDTARDVEAAHAAGAHAVGVATGAATVEELRAAGAEHVLDDLSDPNDLVTVVRRLRDSASGRA